MTSFVPPMDINFYSIRFWIEWSAVLATVVAARTTNDDNGHLTPQTHFRVNSFIYLLNFFLLPKKGNLRKQKQNEKKKMMATCIVLSMLRSIHAVSLQTFQQQQSISFIMFVGLFFLLESNCTLFVWWLFIIYLLNLIAFTFVVRSSSGIVRLPVFAPPHRLILTFPFNTI